MRFSLGDEHAAGFVILDGHNMSVAYLDAPSPEAAQACVDARNVIDAIRERQEVELRAARALFRAALEGRLDDAA